MKNSQQKFIIASLAMSIIISSHSLMANTNPNNPLLNQSREAVSFSWKVQDDYVPNPVNVISSTQESSEYWQIISGAQLAKGFTIKTSAPGALVRINEIRANRKFSAQFKNRTTTSLEPFALEIQAPNGKRFTHGQAMSINVSSKAMRDAGSPFPQGSTGFQLKENLGHGTFTLRNTKAQQSSAQYSIHVFDKHSTQRLSVTRNKANYTTGDLLTLEGDFTDFRTGSHKGIAMKEISGFVRTPHGNTLPLTIKKGVVGQFKTSLPLNLEPEFGGLYEAYIDANANGIKRRVKTAFALVKPTATVRDSFPGTLQSGLPLNLNIKEAGRYEVRGVLYGTNQQGKKQPIINSSVAQWLEPGLASLNLSFDNTLVMKSGLVAPFELKYLQLMDQSRMAKLSLSQQAISIFSDPRSTVAPTPDRLIDSRDLFQNPTNRRFVSPRTPVPQMIRPIPITPKKTRKINSTQSQINHDKR